MLSNDKRPMSEGPEVRRTADKLSSLIIGLLIDKVIFRNAEFQEVVQSLIGTDIERIGTHGKNIVIQFSNGIYLRNHMMMWGKWRIYHRKQYDEGKAKPPPTRGKTHIGLRLKNDKRATNQPSIASTRVVKIDMRNNSNTDSPSSSSTSQEVDDYSIAGDVRRDRRVRLAIITTDYVAVQFNGPILKFSESNPFLTEHALMRLGPDPLKPNFSYEEARIRYVTRLNMKLADLLLDQAFVAGVGNKYKSELLFLCKLSPFINGGQVSPENRDFLIQKIPEVLKFGYENADRTRPLLYGESKNKWDYTHWVFRRAGKLCWVCNTPIKFDRTGSAWVSFWCPSCQKQN
jgi:formamidopyrimidine-DNA glycosylase